MRRKNRDYRGLSVVTLAGLLAAVLSASPAPAQQKHEPAQAEFEVTLPTADAVGSSVDEGTLRAIFSGDVAGHADALATLNAKSIHIPELQLTYDVPAVEDGKPTSGTIVYRDIEISNVVNGVAQSASLGGADVTTSDGGVVKLGKMSTGLFDIGGLLGFYGLVPGKADAPPKTIYKDFVFEGGTLTAPDVTCNIGPVTAAEFKARPLKVSFGEFMALARTMDAERENPSPETISRFVTFYADFLDAFESSPVKLSGFDCSGTDNDGKPIAVSLGSLTVGAFAHGFYPEIAAKDLKIVVEDDGQITLGSALFKGFDFSGPITVLKNAAAEIDQTWFQTHYRQLIPSFEGWAFADFKMDVADDRNPGERIKATVAEFDLTLANYVNGIPTDISTSASHVAVALPAKTEDESIQKLMALGIDKIDVGYELSGRWDAVANSIKIQKLSLTGVDLGTIVAAAVIGKATKEIFSDDTDAALAAVMGMTVKDIKIDLEDSGLATILLQSAAAGEGKDIGAYRTAIAGFAQGTILAVLGATEEATKLSDAVGAFIGGAKSLSIAIAAKDRAGLGMDELNALQENPMALAEKVTIDASAK